MRTIAAAMVQRNHNCDNVCFNGCLHEWLMGTKKMKSAITAPFIQMK